MRSWSSVRMPCAMRICPMWRFAAGATWADILGEFIGRLPLQVPNPRRGQRPVEAAGSLLYEHERAPVELQGLRSLVDGVEAPGELQGVVGVIRLGGQGPGNGQ